MADADTRDEGNRRDVARRALACLDLTNLNDDCTEADIALLCERALTPHGPVAAVCVWPRFVALAKARLAGGPVRIASVVNFPSGGEDTPATVAEAERALADGADEIDTVIPYRLVVHRPDAVDVHVRSVRQACGPALLKAILETGELKDEALIRRASEAAIEAGADFIKTSSGKTKTHASLDAARVMLAVIAEGGGRVGFKPSGGIRTLDDAAAYLDLADAMLGPSWARPSTFRFGASGLLDALLAELDGGEGGAAAVPIDVWPGSAFRARHRPGGGPAAERIRPRASGR